MGGTAMAKPRGVGGTLVLDAQGLVKFATGDPAVRALARKAYERYERVVTAASTLAEVLRGRAEDTRMHRVLQRVNVTSIDKELGREAGELLGATGMSGHRYTVDALLAVVALAQPRPVVLVTSDPQDMARLIEEPGRRKAERIAVIKVLGTLPSPSPARTPARPPTRSPCATKAHTESNHRT
jgi:predicted nucleic acid-binding protein